MKMEWPDDSICCALECTRPTSECNQSTFRAPIKTCSWRMVIMECYKRLINSEPLQVLFCGIIGYAEFRTNHVWLQAMLEWQNRTSGCFPIEISKLNGYPRHGSLAPTHISKRRDIIFPATGCSLHKTSIAMAAMTIQLQQLLLDLSAWSSIGGLS